MRIATALILAMIAGAAHAQTAPARETVHRRRRRGPRQRRAGIRRILRRRRHPRARASTPPPSSTPSAPPRPPQSLRGMAKHNVSVERSSFRLEQSRPARRGRRDRSRRRPNIARSRHSRSRPISSPRSTTSISSIAARRPVRGEDHPLRHQGRGARHRRRAPRGGAGTPAGRPRSMPTPPASSSREILEIFDGVAQNLGSEASLRAATPNVQVSPPATIPFRAGDQHQMADRLARLEGAPQHR